MGKVKQWLMTMEEDAAEMSKLMFVLKHGAVYQDIWDKINELPLEPECKIFNHKDYKIKIWEQTPDVDYPTRNFAEEFQGQGTHGYEVFNPRGESIHKDTWDMWDEDACYENACQDVDADLGGKA